MNHMETWEEDNGDAEEYTTPNFFSHYAEHVQNNK